ncbi:MAG TPA: CGNR zinc finger domain-containing protein [Candidatus Tumulicola sp.]|jgi:predicted RNA-binding Zn ribbon-like protein
MLGSSSLDFVAFALENRSVLAAVLVRFGLLSFEPPVRPEDLADAQLLQAAAQRCFVAAAQGGGQLPPRDLATVNSYAADEPPVVALRADGSATRSAADPVRAALAAIARDVVETIARNASSLRTCQGAGCARPFLDSSRAGLRRWCSMSRCGNRVKVAAFRRRSQNSPEVPFAGS